MKQQYFLSACIFGLLFLSTPLFSANRFSCWKLSFFDQTWQSEAKAPKPKKYQDFLDQPQDPLFKKLDSIHKEYASKKVIAELYIKCLKPDFKCTAETNSILIEYDLMTQEKKIKNPNKVLQWFVYEDLVINKVAKMSKQQRCLRCCLSCCCKEVDGPAKQVEFVCQFVERLAKLSPLLVGELYLLARVTCFALSYAGIFLLDRAGILEKDGTLKENWREIITKILDQEPTEEVMRGSSNQQHFCTGEYLAVIDIREKHFSILNKLNNNEQLDQDELKILFNYKLVQDHTYKTIKDHEKNKIISIYNTISAHDFDVTMLLNCHADQLVQFYLKALKKSQHMER